MEPGGTFYIVVDKKGRVETFRSFREAISSLASFTPPVRIYRAVLIAILDASEIREVGSHEKPSTGAKEEARRPIAVVVLDQMFRGFGEVLARELGEAVEVHEIVGRGLSETIKRGRVYLEPARDDYDVLTLLEKLGSREHLVIFFTGDKKLANQASTLQYIHVVYMPPSEIPGKEIAIKRMISEIRRVLEEAWA